MGTCAAHQANVFSARADLQRQKITKGDSAVLLEDRAENANCSNQTWGLQLLIKESSEHLNLKKVEGKTYESLFVGVFQNLFCAFNRVQDD